MKKTIELPVVDGQVSRRTLLKNALAGLGVAMCSSTLATVLTGCEYDVLKPAESGGAGVQLALSEVPELEQVGGAVRRAFSTVNGGYPVIIVRTGEASFAVLSAVCTHAGCIVNPPAAPNQSLVCPCHGAQYNAADGAVIVGPAELPLPAIAYSWNAATSILTIDPKGEGKPVETVSVTVDLSEYPELETQGVAAKIYNDTVNGGRAFMLVRLSEESFLAVSAVCPVQGCEVDVPEAPGANFICGCDGAEFSSTTGKWQESPQQAADLIVFPSQLDIAQNTVTIEFPKVS